MFIVHCFFIVPLFSFVHSLCSLCVPQISIMKRLFGLNRIMVKHTDARVKVSNEAMMGMQVRKEERREERKKEERKKGDGGRKTLRERK